MDNCPRFPVNLYPECNPRFISMTVLEGLKKNTELMQLNCTDPDNAGGGQLTWTIMSGNVRGVFQVTKTGMVRTKKKPDAEGRVNPYTLFISASDAGEPSLAAVVVLNIFISSINDEPPRIEGLPSVIDVPEDSPVGTIVTSCTLVDDDTSRLPQGLARVEIISGNEDNFYRLDAITCALSLNERLDYETMGPRTLRLRARDLDTAAPLTTEQSVTINIVDVNDHRPTCEEYVIFLTVAEDTVVGEEVTSLNCSDIDVSDTLQYVIAPGSPDLLAVDLNTGVMTVARALDFETDANFDVTVHVHDLSAVPFTTTVVVVVEVTDVDDNIPQFADSLITAGRGAGVAEW
nr:hypothetical protein BaRGS_028124 [Batillaria attramentaria]